MSVKDRKGEDINEGDHVWTRYRGGVREGDVHTYSPFFQNQLHFRGIWLILPERKGPENRHG
jgi:hypothetical protein